VLSAQWEAIESLKLVDLPEHRPEPGQVVVEVAHCGICGSDLHSYHEGFVVEPGQVLGHEFVGTVVEAPGVEGLEIGQRVTARPLVPCGECGSCLEGEIQRCEAGMGDNVGYGRRGAFAERVLVPKAVVGEVVFPVPDAIDDRSAALIEPLAVGLHAIHQAEVEAGQTALVLGAGPIGLGVVAFLRRAGVGTLIVSDPSAKRRAAAATLGADRVIDPLAENVVEAVAGITGVGAYGAGARADVVIDCAGVAPALGDALRCVRSGGHLVFCAMYAKKVDFRPDMVTMKEITLRGALGYKHEFPEVIAALAEGGIDTAAMISHELPLSEIEEAFRIQSDPEASLKVLVTP
jgi:(R,R)-butanediol dehydrogenase / meso-butanediol dehydrogenase / diacetyl reductase